MNDFYKTALTYLGTPHINGGNIKGAGLDCCTLIAAMAKETKDRDVHIEFGYSGDWFCKKECKEILLPYLEDYCYRVAELKPGDIISYKWGRAQYAHLSMYLGNGLVIHSRAEHGTEITERSNPIFFNRETGIWRLK